MTKEQIAEYIEKELFITYNSVKVTTKDNKIFYGFFQNFEDYQQLKQALKYRFIPNNNSAKFQEELRQTQKLNPQHSIILDCADIAKIEVVID